METNIAVAISLITFLGLAFQTFFNFKKITDNIREDASWRTSIATKLTYITETLNALNGIDKLVSLLQQKIETLNRDLGVANTSIKELRDKK